MNKLDFLRRLDRELSVLEKEERREILAFYEERFYNGTIYENKTEEEVIAELERPEIIARNVLEEYGVSPKFVKNKEERFTNVSTARVILLICFDVFIVSAVLPALYSASVAILGSSLTWVTTLGLVIGPSSAVDQYVFAFITGGFILLFMFGLVVLEAALWFTRTVIKWHLNTFKFKNRGTMLKKLSHFSLDSWFKKHRGARKLKNFMLVAALFALVISGSWIFRHYDWVEAEYTAEAAVNETITEDFTDELAEGAIWQITTDLENIAVEVVQGTTNDVVIRHSYHEDDDFEYNFDYDLNMLTISNDTDPSINFFWDPSELFNLINSRNAVVIELPNGLELADVEIVTSNNSIYIRNINFADVTLQSSNGAVEVINAFVSGDANFITSNNKVDVSNSEFLGYLDIDTSNGKVAVRDVSVEEELNIKSSNNQVDVLDVQGSLTSDLIINTSNGKVFVKTTGFENYDIKTSNAKVVLTSLNTVLEPAKSVVVETDNGEINATDVYALDIEMTTSNGDIEYHNDDTSFHPTSLDLDTSSYNDVDTNVTAD